MDIYIASANYKSCYNTNMYPETNNEQPIEKLQKSNECKTKETVNNHNAAKNNKSEKRPMPLAAVISIVLAIVAFVIVLTTTLIIVSQNNAPANSDWSETHRRDKPLIYLYPTHETEVSVKLGKPENLTTTYPKYEDGWVVTAKPDGTLSDAAGRTYYGLYWEGKDAEVNISSEGFVVKKQDTIAFLEEKLSILGLTEREANEFIIYWLPKLEENPYNYIRFETKSKIDAAMPLEITPQPDSIIRIMIDFKGLEAPIEVTPQDLQTPQREGFTVVEWGGSEIE